MMPVRAIAFAAALVLSAIAPASAGPHAAQLYYLHAGQIDLNRLLAPPPEPGSARQQYEERKIEEVLAARTPADIARADADSTRLVFVFTDALGSRFTADRVPLAKALFERVGSDTEILVKEAKASFARPRPPHVPQTHGSYPSGHAAFASCTAILLAQMVPEKRGAIFDRAAIFAESRVIAGVHYPSDVQAGWISGTVVAAALMNDPKFEADFAAAKSEVRAALGLP